MFIVKESSLREVKYSRIPNKKAFLEIPFDYLILSESSLIRVLFPLNTLIPIEFFDSAN